MSPMTPHEKECAFAAIGLRLELATKQGNRQEAREWRKFMQEVKIAPLVDDTGIAYQSTIGYKRNNP